MHARNLDYDADRTMPTEGTVPTEGGAPRKGEIIALSEGRFILRVGTASRIAERALSCLVEPEVGDQVLVASVEGDHFVLAVLRRPGESKVTLSTPGDLRVDLPAGRFEVVAEEGVTLASKKRISMLSKEIELQGAVGRFAIERLSVLGSSLETGLGKVRAVAGSVDAVCDRMVQRLKHGFRFVSETDRVEAGQIEMTAAGMMSVHAKEAVMHTDELMKIDGDQVHVG